ncbi:serine protease, partial [Leptospira santarosai]
MLRIWIVPIIVCFTLGIFAEKAKSDLIPIKKKPLPLAKTVLSGKETQEVYHKSIVQIKVTFQEPEYHQPWKKKNPRVRRGVGSVVEGNRILIPYSLLPDATLIEVKKYSSYS